VFRRDNYQCAACRRFSAKLECDHIIPLDAGGTDEMRNLQTLCRPCHIDKTRRENVRHQVIGQEEWAGYV